MFSWEIPLEQEILKYCTAMANRMRESEAHNKEYGWFANNRLSEDCGTMAKAYETVADFVSRQIKFRHSITLLPQTQTAGLELAQKIVKGDR